MVTGFLDPTMGHTPRSRLLARNYALGFLSSLLIALASVGIGWMAPQGLRETPFLVAVRSSTPAVIACWVGVVAGGLGLTRAWLRIATRLRPWGEGSSHAVLRAALYWSAPLMLALPLFSRDVFAYIAQGRLVQAGMNPYVDGMSSVPGWQSIGADPMWAESRTPYGPLFLIIAWLVVGASNNIPEVAILLFRLVAFAGVALCMVFVPKLAILNKVNPAKALWLSVASPLFLFHFVLSVHNDALMIGLLLAGTYLVQRGTPVPGLLLVAASIAIKPITLIALPFLGLIWAGRGAGWGRKALCWAATAVLSLGPVLALGLVVGWGLGWVEALSTPGQASSWYAPVTVVATAVDGVALLFGVENLSAVSVLKNVTLAAAALFCAYLVLSANRWSPPRRMMLAFTAVVLSAPVIHPWYLLWILVLWAVVGVSYGTELRVFVLSMTFFVAYAMVDSMDVSPLVQNRALIEGTALVVTCAGLAMLTLLDPRTRAFFLRGAYPEGDALPLPRPEGVQYDGSSPKSPAGAVPPERTRP